MLPGSGARNYSRHRPLASYLLGSLIGGTPVANKNIQQVGAIQVLQDDHKHISGLFRQAEGLHAKDSTMKEGVIRQLIMEMEIHSEMEKQIFYPEFEKSAREKGSTEDVALVNSFYAVHAELDEQVRVLRDHAKGTDYATLESLAENFEAHIHEEEEKLFPIAHQFLADTDQEIGTRMQEFKQDQMKNERYRDALPSVTQNPSGGEQMRPKGSEEAA